MGSGLGHQQLTTLAPERRPPPEEIPEESEYDSESEDDARRKFDQKLSVPSAEGPLFVRCWFGKSPSVFNPMKRMARARPDFEESRK